MNLKKCSDLWSLNYMKRRWHWRACWRGNLCFYIWHKVHTHSFLFIFPTTLQNLSVGGVGGVIVIQRPLLSCTREIITYRCFTSMTKFTHPTGCIFVGNILSVNLSKTFSFCTGPKRRQPGHCQWWCRRHGRFVKNRHPWGLSVGGQRSPLPIFIMD